jgi:DNA invertase Pin-like site-specific DNA recombinase
MGKVSLVGKRYVNLLRASTDLQDTSTDDQKVVNDKHAQKIGMIHVDDVPLKGVSGSKTFNRRDLKDLLERRRLFKNYDVILVYDSSRLTRGGATHAATIRRDFAKLGVLIISVMDHVPEGDFKDVIQSVIDTQNHLYSKKHSGFVTRGIYDAVKNGVTEKHGGSPYGIDRLYLDMSGKPMLRLKYLTGGVRRLIHVATGDFRDIRRGENPGAAHLLGAGERSILVPGDDKIQEVVREVFKLRYSHGMGYTRIARYVASTGIYPKISKKWTPNAMRDILLNPCYLGWSYPFYLKTGLFHNIAADRPEERDINQDALEEAGLETVPRERHDLSNIAKVYHPALANFISDPIVREAASKAIECRFHDWHKRHNDVVLDNPNRRPNSHYFLRGVLRDFHYDRSFSGSTTGRNGDTRYYVVNAAIELVERSTPLAYRIRAEPIENAALNAIRVAFSDTQLLTDGVQRYVASTIENQPSQLRVKELEQESEDLKNKLAAILETFSHEEMKNSGEYISGLRNRRSAIERDLSLTKIETKANPKELVESITNDLLLFDRKLDGDCFEKLRLLIKTICPRIVFNLETFEADIEVALPKSLIHAGTAWSLMSGTYGQDVSTGCKAHRDFWLPIALFRLKPVFGNPYKHTGRLHTPVVGYTSDANCCPGLSHNLSPNPKSVAINP